MRSIHRIFVSSQDSDVPAQLAVAREAERLGLEGTWVHGPHTGHSDSYATAAAAAVASVTTDLRLGVVLDLAKPDDVLRLAEDVAVLDHCSSGRAELWLDGSAAADPQDWPAIAERFVTNLHTCSAGDGELAVTPGPLQPMVPVVIRGSRVTIADAGVVVELDDPSPPTHHGTRRVLRATAEQTRSALAAADEPDSLRAAVEDIRTAIHISGARDLIFVLPTAAAIHAVDIVASVLAPILRASDHEVPDLVLDTVKFRCARRRFNRAADAIQQANGRSERQDGSK